MIDRLTKLYENPQKKPLFASNERVYDAFLGKQFKDFRPNADDNYFLKVNDHFISYAAGNEKIFSQLKHLSYEFAGHFAKAGEAVHKIVATLESYLKVQGEAYKKVNFEPSESVSAMNKRFLVGLSEWGSQLLIQKKFIIDNMAGFFHYKKHEYSELSKLLALQNDLQSKFKKRAAALESTKQKLFETKNIEKMRIKLSDVRGDASQVLKDYDSARDFILPEETRQLADAGGVVSFLRKHMLFEYINFYQNSMFYIQENFADLTRKMLRSLKNVGLSGRSALERVR